jgi:hypothetical protein
MLTRLLPLLLLCSVTAFSAENLQHADYVGVWAQTHPITEGEVSTLTISEDLAARFTRAFSSESPDQEFATKASGLRFDGDLAIVEFHWRDGNLAYKLVLSGWRVKGHRKIFGTMYMYRDGKLYNGLPVGFTINS